MAFRVAVLLSGEGTNLQALLDGVHGRDGVEIVAVASNRAEARGLERARAAGIETAVFAAAPRGGSAARDSSTSLGDATAALPVAPKASGAALDDLPPRDERDRALGDWLERHDIDLVVLAGFMEILSGAFIRRFAARIVNVHPSLLPAFPGVRAIEQALAYGAKLVGVTVHLVDEGVDTGPIVLQEAIEAPYSRDIAETEQRIHAVEHRLLPQAVRLFAQGKVHMDTDDPRLVRIENGER
ncbi:MAG TPA: phosphoribosylglycinamide formyltransferase [Thermoleophilaceae bacterium]